MDADIAYVCIQSVVCAAPEVKHWGADTSVNVLSWTVASATLLTVMQIGC